MPPIRVGVATLGTFKSQSGKATKFDRAFMQTLMANTNGIIKRGVFIPPVSYGTHPAHKLKDHDAHGQLVGVELEDDVLSVLLDKPSKKLREAVNDGRILSQSLEYVDEFEHPDANGDPVKVGPVIVGLATLGNQRAAVKSERVVPIGRLQFSEGVTVEEGTAARAGLVKNGVVRIVFDGDVMAFTEVAIDRDSLASDEVVSDDDPATFRETQEHTTMTDAEIQAAIRAATQPLADANKALADANKALEDRVSKFSETSKRESEAHSFCEKFATDRAKKAPLPKLSMDRLEDLLSDSEMTPGTITKLKAFAESLPGAYVAAPKTGDDKKKADDEDADEPKALAALRPKHFADRTGANEQLIEDGLVAFGEFKPDAFKGIESNVNAQLERLKSYVTTRDTAN